MCCPNTEEHTSLCLEELTVQKEKEWELHIIHRARIKGTFLFVFHVLKNLL